MTVSLLLLLSLLQAHTFAILYISDKDYARM